MDIIGRQIARARRRLLSQIGFRLVSRFLLIALTIAVIAIVVPKLWYLPLSEWPWYWGWIGACSALALISSMITSWLYRPTPLVAAIEIDKRFGLKERLSSAWQLGEVDQQSSAGQALVHDAIAKAERIDVRDAFPIGLSRSMSWNLIPVALLAGLAFLPDATKPEAIASKRSNQVDLNQVKTTTQPLVEAIRKKREEAEKEGLEDAVEMYKQIEQKLDDLRKNEKLDAKQAMAKLGDIKQELQKRRDELGSGENLKKNLKENLNKIDSGPAEKMSNALQEGDLEKAQSELEKMMDNMASGQMSAAEQKQLAKQLEQMEQAIQESLEKHENAKQMLKEQLEQAEQAGDVQKAAQLRKQLEQLNSMEQQMSEMAEMKELMQEMKEALESGDQEAAKEAMEKMMDKLSEMQEQMDEMEELDEMLDELAESKKGMQGRKGMRSRMPGQGDGDGEGQGFGERPEEETDTDQYDAQVRDQMRAGETVFKGKVTGSNRKGQTREEVKQAILSAEIEEAESLDSVVLPKAQRDQTQQYFDAMRSGKGE